MPLVAILLGLAIIDTGLRGTEHNIAGQLGKDFGGTAFVSWAGAIIIIGGIGEFPALNKISSGLLLLVVAVMVLRNGGVFSQLSQVIDNPPAPVASVPLSNYAASGSSSLLGSVAGSVVNSIIGGGL
jgi:hypothetical protein